MTMDELRDLTGLVSRVIAAGKVYQQSRKPSDYFEYHELWLEARDRFDMAIPAVTLKDAGPKVIA